MGCGIDLMASTWSLCLRHFVAKEGELLLQKVALTEVDGEAVRVQNFEHLPEVVRSDATSGVLMRMSSR